jgi:uncharacterized protein (DUF1810 family)
MQSDAYELSRFIDAQSGVYDDVCIQLRSARKTSHWMWFVFPQLRPLGRSSIAKYYGIEDAREATAYWQHPLLGPRLAECAELVLATKGKSAHEIFGSPDDLKLCSCMTLFEQVARDEAAFGLVLERFYGGRRDPLSVLPDQAGARG